MKIIPDKRNRYEIIIKRVYVFKNEFKDKKIIRFLIPSIPSIRFIFRNHESNFDDQSFLIPKIILPKDSMIFLLQQSSYSTNPNCFQSHFLIFIAF